MTPDGDPPHTPTRLAAIRIGGTDGSRTTVELADGATFTLATDAFLALNLSRGDPVDGPARQALADAGLRSEAREAALRLLSHRPRSRAELERRLRRKDLPGALVGRVADEMEALGYLDDDAFARAWVRDRLRLKPRGRAALRAELRKKGVAARVVDAALDQVFAEEEVSEGDIAGELAEKWIRRQPARIADGLLAGGRSDDARKARRRYQGFMARRGLSGAAAWQALERVRARREDRTEG